MRHAILALCAAAVLAEPLPAQTVARPSEEQIRANWEADRGDFDYLLGDWEFTSVSREHGPGQGYWSAVRLDDGQIVDEYRVVGDTGQYVTTTFRNYNAVLDRWELVGADAGTGLQDMGTARRVGNEMHMEQRFGVLSPEPSLWRIRYYDIRPDGFSWAADRTRDNGATWERDVLTIRARRIGPVRTLPALAPARNRPGTAREPRSGIRLHPRRLRAPGPRPRIRDAGGGGYHRREPAAAASP